MKVKFYKRPLALQRIMSGQELEQVGLQESINQSLELIITTHFGEHRFQHNYGCAIWDLDFVLIVSESQWEEKLRLSMLESISRHEKRLGSIKIEVQIQEVNFQHYSLRNTQVKKQVDIRIHAKILITGEDYHFKSKLYLSPLSVG